MPDSRSLPEPQPICHPCGQSSTDGEGASVSGNGNGKNGTTESTTVVGMPKPPAASQSIAKTPDVKGKRRSNALLNLLERHPVLVGLAIRLSLMLALPLLMDDGLLLKGVRYTDIDYDVFTDAANHVANGRSPYDRHTYRYTPFLAKLLALPQEYPGSVGMVFSPRYFGKVLFCLADVVCGYIILTLRRKKRNTYITIINPQSTNGRKEGEWTTALGELLSPELKDALWWLYNPLPINICTRGSAESLVVLLPVLISAMIADAYQIHNAGGARRTWTEGTLPVALRACVAGAAHGVGVHAKLYPVVYTVSFMANFSRQQHQREAIMRKGPSGAAQRRTVKRDEGFWTYLSREQMQIDPSKSVGGATFPWRQPDQILALAVFWVQRLFFTMSSVLFLASALGTVATLTYLAVDGYGQRALDEGLLYHFQRVDHRHNYSIYWYWIYLARGKAEAGTALAQSTSNLWGQVPLLPQIIILGFTSLGIAPHDLSFALFCQTFAFVTFNKVITAQYFTWYLCLLPLCSDRINWNSKRMFYSVGLLIVSIITWLLSAFTLEMLGWRTHRQVWLASLFFFVANVNLVRSILGGYKKSSDKSVSSLQLGEGTWAIMTAKMS